MQKKLEQIRADALDMLDRQDTIEQLEEVYKAYLGKGGQLQEILRGLKDLSPEEKKTVGAHANQVRIEIQNHYEEMQKLMRAKEIEKRIKSERLDTSLPGKTMYSEMRGVESPFSVFLEECVEVFKRMGFGIWDGKHIVSDYENFEALNFPENHPARAMQDTFYVEGGDLLRTHTSALQNEILKTKDFPIRALVPGKCFRNEATDARHEAIFIQLEGVVVDKDINISHLIGTLEHFLREIFKKDIKTRIRPGYFPFVEPGLELETECLICGGTGDNCRLCKGLGWLEVMPCGMIHPNVLEEAGIDSKEYSGFAFGFGVSRLAQLRYDIEDCRLMFSADPKYLRQF